MGAIHKLSPILSNQIAAGEVVERPASVVKELVENAIDAQSTQIDIHIDQAGFERIQVIDNGQGIDPKELPLAFTRHATSKIKDRRDLFNVHSLGFRGEALPSIASIADVTLQTANGQRGGLFHIRGGEVIDQHPADLRQGTTVTVAHLFFNTPARLKYMKTPATELAKITSVVNQIALGHPEVSFVLTHNHRELLKTAGRNDQLQVISAIYGTKPAQKMIAFQGQDLDFKIHGYFSRPELTRANRNYVVLILNGRFVKNLKLEKALLAGYGSKLMVGRYPIAVLNVQVDPTLVDVNVHPTKQLVKVSKEAELCNLITDTIANCFLKQNLIPNGLDREHNKRPHHDLQQLSVALETNSDHYQARPAEPKLIKKKALTTGPVVHPQHDLKPPRLISIHNQQELAGPAVHQFVNYYQNEAPMRPFAADPKAPLSKPTPKHTDDSALQQFPDLTYIGQMHGTYLLAEAEDGLYIVDQHAAQERINYERLRVRIGQVSTAQQELLVPIVLEYPTAETLIINERVPLLAKIGISLEPFGKNSFVVKRHPTWLAAETLTTTIQALVDWVIQHGRASVAQFRQATAIMMSCKQAIKANHHLNRTQAEALLNGLRQMEDPFNCPHGRPVLVRFTNYDLEKMFKRVQDAHQRASSWD